MQVKTTQLTCTRKTVEGKDMLVRLGKPTDLHLSTKQALRRTLKCSVITRTYSRQLCTNNCNQLLKKWRHSHSQLLQEQSLYCFSPVSLLMPLRSLASTDLCPISTVVNYMYLVLQLHLPTITDLGPILRVFNYMYLVLQLPLPILTRSSYFIIMVIYSILLQNSTTLHKCCKIDMHRYIIT